MMRRFLVVPLCALVLGLVLTGTGCAKQTSANPNPDDPGDNPTPGVVDDGAGFYVRYVTSTKYFYDLHKDATGFGTACSAVANESVTCYLDGPELDFLYNGVTLQYNVPSNLCTYVRFRPYYFLQYAVFAAPTLVRSDTTANGTVCYDANSNGACDGGEVAETCAYDYTSNGGPNCCEGGYTQILRTWAPLTGYASAFASQETWDGQVGNCLNGPATKSQPKNVSNVPLADLTYVEGTGLNKTYEIASPISLGLITNTFFANFYDPLDHGGGKPAGLTTTNAVAPAPFYTWQCLDTAEDVIAEIALVVREWNTKAAFDARASSPTGYDASGPEDNPFNVSNVKNDRPDWADFDAVFPGKSL